jgi:uncharacterized protein YfaQ (DUF2300 family)
MRTDAGAPEKPPELPLHRTISGNKTRRKAGRNTTRPGRESTAPARPLAESANTPIASVEALLKVAGWLDQRKRRNPEASGQIQRQRADADTK